MDLKRLRAFVAVAEHGTVSKAAQMLHITQPALSRQIGAFEQDIGFKLFQRAGRRVALTPRAEQMLGECRSLLTHVSSVDERAQALRRGDIRALKIAGSAMTIEGTFPTFLHCFAERFPGTRLALIEADATEHLDMLHRGEVHFAINVINVVEVDDNQFGSFLLPRFHIHAAWAHPFDFGAVDTIEIRRLTDHPLLLPNRSYATRNLFDAACRLAGVRPDIQLESGSSSTLLAMAAAGHGVAVIPSILHAGSGKLRCMRVTHRGELLQIAPAVIWDKRRTLPRYAEGFSEVLAEHLRAVFPDGRPAQRSGKSVPVAAAPAAAPRLAGGRRRAARAQSRR